RQDEINNESVLLVVNCRFEGWHGFYKGLSANLTRVTPATVITFAVYENVSHYLQELKQRHKIEEEKRHLPVLIKKVET
ncbi:Mitochondrial folate transporter/carrier, partial [Dufourea novaeangliae]